MELGVYGCEEFGEERECSILGREGVSPEESREIVSEYYEVLFLSDSEGRNSTDEVYMDSMEGALGSLVRDAADFPSGLGEKTGLTGDERRGIGEGDVVLTKSFFDSLDVRVT